MHKNGESAEFDLMIGGTAWTIDESFGTYSYILAMNHGSTVLTMLRNAMAEKDILFPPVWRMRVLVMPEGYKGSYSFRDWDEYQPQYLFEFKRLDDLAKSYFAEREE